MRRRDDATACRTRITTPKSACVCEHPAPQQRSRQHPREQHSVFWEPLRDFLRTSRGLRRRGQATQRRANHDDHATRATILHPTPHGAADRFVKKNGHRRPDAPHANAQTQRLGLVGHSHSRGFRDEATVNTFFVSSPPEGRGGVVGDVRSEAKSGLA